MGDFDELYLLAGGQPGSGGSTPRVSQLALNGVPLASGYTSLLAGDVVRLQGAPLRTGFTLTGLLAQESHFAARTQDDDEEDDEEEGELALLIFAARTDQAPGTAAVVFDAKLGKPLPAGLLTLSNQAEVEAPALPARPSDDPATLESGDATRTPLLGSPDLRATQRMRLLNDLDHDGRAGGGDRLEVRVTVDNPGSAPSHGVELLEAIPAHTRVVPGSVSTTAGSILSADPLLVRIGTLLPLYPPISLVPAHLADATAIPNLLAAGGAIRFATEARIGRSSEWELAMMREPFVTTDGTFNSTDFDDWTSSAHVSFTLTYDGANQVRMKLSRGSARASIANLPAHDLVGDFDELYLRTRATNSGSRIVVDNLVLDGLPVDGTSSAINLIGDARDVLRIRGGRLGDGFTLTGRITLHWTGTKPKGSQLDLLIWGARGGPAGLGTASVVYQLDVDSPLPAGVDAIRSQGQVTSDEQPVLVTRDPAKLQTGTSTALPADGGHL